MVAQVLDRISDSSSGETGTLQKGARGSANARRALGLVYWRAKPQLKNWRHSWGQVTQLPLGVSVEVEMILQLS